MSFCKVKTENIEEEYEIDNYDDTDILYTVKNGKRYYVKCI